jgi:integrase/recombinase XerD
LSNTVFISPFHKEIKEFIALKRAIGYKYLTEAGILRRFDSFLSDNYHTLDSLTKEAITRWCARTSHETAANQCSRSSVIRQFCKYMDGIGRDAWIMPKNYYPTGMKYVPHIYTPNELRRFFAETNKCHYCYEVPHRHLIIPVFFRLLFSCGLRCSEARLLKVREVDLENGVLSVMDSKNHNSRLVPMPLSMTLRMREYARKVHPFPEPEGYFFPAFAGKPMTLGNVYKNFRRFLWKAGISHTGDGPRVHDFRHTYCIYRLKAWAEQDRNLLILIPMLRTYLGHETFNETAYYLRLTADVFPDIRLKLERHYAAIIPDVREVTDDSY